MVNGRELRIPLSIPSSAPRKVIPATNITRNELLSEQKSRDISAPPRNSLV